MGGHVFLECMFFQDDMSYKSICLKKSYAL